MNQLSTKRLSPERIAHLLCHEMGETAANELRGHIEAIEAELLEQCTDLYWMRRANQAEKELDEAKVEIVRLSQLFTATQLQSESRGNALLAEMKRNRK